LVGATGVTAEAGKSVHWPLKISGISTAWLLVFEVLLVGAAAVFADLLGPTAPLKLEFTKFLFEGRLFARFLVVAFFVGTPPGVFVDQDALQKTHGSDQSGEGVGMKKLALVCKCMSDKIFILDVILGAESDAGGFGRLSGENLIKKRLHRIFAW